MTLSEYSFRLQKGITGGFAPPRPSEIHSITRTQGSDTVSVESAVRPDGTPQLQSAGPRSFKSEDHTSLIEELHDILKSIPTESPPGSEDIYGMDTSIFWGSEDLQWCNGGPQGCGGGNSMVKATDEDKVKFKRAVEIVETLVKTE
ncbi:hypothetical protein C8J56DRAFT_1012477 [Mycena floridula]|nr:hypothetical protein C8J56DRAFT_1012477 [Mycena floridula]